MMMNDYEQKKDLVNRLLLQFNLLDSGNRGRDLEVCSNETDYLLKQLGFRWKKNGTKMVRSMLNYAFGIKFFTR
jgi:hypothetical protein